MFLEKIVCVEKAKFAYEISIRARKNPEFRHYETKCTSMGHVQQIQSEP